MHQNTDAQGKLWSNAAPKPTIAVKLFGLLRDTNLQSRFPWLLERIVYHPQGSALPPPAPQRLELARTLHAAWRDICITSPRNQHTDEQ